MIKKSNQPQQESNYKASLRPFWAIVQKEIGDHTRSWRAIILLSIVALTCLGSLYSSLSNFREAISSNSGDSGFFFSESVHSIGWHPSFFLCIRKLPGALTRHQPWL